MPDGERIKETKVLDVVQDYDQKIFPERYLRVITHYVDSKTNGTVTFFPEDFGNIIFFSRTEAECRSKAILSKPKGTFYGFD